MKISRLSSTEVANISALPFERKHAALQAVEEPRVRWSYQPVEDALPKILLADSALFGSLPTGKDEEIVKQVEKACKSGPEQAAACKAVARSIVTWRNEKRVFARIVPSDPLRMSVGALRYCADVVPIVDGEPVIVNLDCRSSMVLTAGGKEFMKSLIHHTARIGDLRSSRVGILRTPRQMDGSRKCTLEFLEGQPQYSLEQILKAITETYTVWEMILRSRRASSAASDG